METEVTRKLFTIEEFSRMDEAGVFAPDTRVELIHGEIIEMSPMNPPHTACVLRATTILVPPLVGRAIVSIRCAVECDLYSMPQPDVMLLRPRSDFYATKRQASEDVFLVMEVSDTTLRYDRKVKVPLYAASGVPEVWIADVRHHQLLVYRELDGEAYKTCLTLKHGESVWPLAFPDLVIKIEDLIG